MNEFFKKQAQTIGKEMNKLKTKKIEVIHLAQENVSEYNQDFGGHENVSPEFNEFLKLRGYCKVI